MFVDSRKTQEEYEIWIFWGGDLCQKEKRKRPYSAAKRLVQVFDA